MSQSNGNVVALPKPGQALAPAPGPATPQGAPAPGQQWWGGNWPANPIYPGNPPPNWAMPGCGPPCPPNSLMNCYCDIQNAQQFLSAMMIDLINNNPAVAQAMISAIEKSGSALPLIGVTDGSNAQPGQVGEYLINVTQFSFAAGDSTNVMAATTLPAGDWDCWLYLGPSEQTDLLLCSQSPWPAAGWSGQLFAIGAATSPVWVAVVGNQVRYSSSQPALVAWTLEVQGAVAAGTCNVWFQARRRR